LTIKANFERYINMYENTFGRIELPENTVEKIYNQMVTYATIESSNTITNDTSEE